MAQRFDAVTLTMRLSGRGLADLDFFSKSDPRVRLERYTPFGWCYIEGCQTEVIDDELDPDFVTRIVYTASTPGEKLRFIVWDSDGPLFSPDLIGYTVTIKVEDLIMHAKNNLVFCGRLDNKDEPGRENGTISVAFE